MLPAALFTPRLLLRPLLPADAPGMFALDSDPAVHRYLGGVGGTMVTTLAESEATIRYIRAQYAASGIGRWAVLLATTGEFMGWAGLKLVAGPVNGQRDFYDLGYRLLPRYWGQGYASEAAAAWLRAGFESLGLPRVCAYADVANAASCRVLAKVGMRTGGEFLEGGTRCRWFEVRNSMNDTFYFL